MQEMADQCMSDEVVVEEEEVILVKPAGAAGHGRHYLYLSSLDLCWRGAPYSRRVLFYEKGRDTIEPLQVEAMVTKLKSSLAQVLQAFYPAAGRLVPPHHPNSGRPSIFCNDQGVEFIVARVNAPLSLLQYWPRFLHSLARSYPPSQLLVDQHLLPLLSVQVTKLFCGGLAIGISYCNILADGHSFWHLMNSWAECARDEVISIQPCHNREVFKVAYPSEDVATQFFLPTCNVANPEDLTPNAEVHKLLHFTTMMIKKIKCQAYEDLHGAPIATPLTDYDVLCAFVWKIAIASSTNSSKQDLLSSNICVLGDMRFRMEPQLPRGYFGNATIFAYASASKQALKEGSIGSIALQIVEACKACNEPRLWGIVNWLELHDSFFNAKNLPWRVSDINVASSPRFKVYNVDFGWGKPIIARPSQFSNNHDMFLFPGRHGGIDIYLAWPASLVNQVLQKLNELST
ncbi:hypothetical protein L7F22_051546 [Adiantum nelumboides]|nr:hypothetical protein [Adiantum nelumboides]